MSDGDPSNLEHVADLIARLTDGALNERESAMLRERLTSDPAALRLYLEQVELHAILTWQGDGDRHLGYAAPIESGGALPTILNASNREPSSSPLAASPPAADASGANGLSLVSWSVWFIAAAAVAGAFALGFQLAPRTISLVTAANDDRAREDAPTALLARTVECRWSPNGSPRNEGDSLSAGQRIEIDQGLAELSFDKGTQAFLRGPAALVVESPRSARLLSGAVTVIAPSGERSFELHTALVTTIACGSELALVAEENGATEVHVMQGYVSVDVETRGSQIASQQVLLAGEACRFEPTGESRRWREDAPPADVPRAAASSSQSTEYQRAVLADRPAMYWNFDEIGLYAPAVEWVSKSVDRRLYPLGGAKRVSHAALQSGLALGQAADLTGSVDCFITNLRSKPLRGPWALELWLQIERREPGATHQYILHSNPSATNSSNPSLIFDFGDGVDNELEMYSKEPGVDPSLAYRPRTDGGPIIDDTRWRHILVVSYGSWDERALDPKLEIYVDGQPLADVKRNHFAANFQMDTLLVGAARTFGLNDFSGRLDELAVYDLSGMKADQIAPQMAAMARRHIDAAKKPAAAHGREASPENKL